jgi:hypothetical protein
LTSSVAEEGRDQRYQVASGRTEGECFQCRVTRFPETCGLQTK